MFLSIVLILVELLERYSLMALLPDILSLGIVERLRSEGFGCRSLSLFSLIEHSQWRLGFKHWNWAFIS